MEKRRVLTKNKTIIMSTVITAVLVAVLLGIALRSLDSDDAVSPGMKEAERLRDQEISLLRERDRAYAEAFAKSGGSSDEYAPMESEVRLDILYASDSILSVVITTDSEDTSPFGREKYYNIHRDTGKHLTLFDVLGYDFRKKVKEKLLPQVEADGDVYDGIDVVPMINEDLMFYIDEGGDGVVVVFDVGEIAPDSAGMKTYRIPADIFVS